MTSSSASPPVADEKTMPFDAYLTAAARPRQSYTHWPWTSLEEQTASNLYSERGLVALVTDAGKGEVAPGLSMVVQVVLQKGSTSPHRHSFWHIYVVKSGAGKCCLDDGIVQPLAPGDVLFVPAWETHGFENASEDQPLVLLALQNLPQLAGMGALMRGSGAGEITHVYREASASGEAVVQACASRELCHGRAVHPNAKEAL